MGSEPRAGSATPADVVGGAAGATRHLTASDLTGFEPPPGGEPRRASVLILFGEGSGGPTVLLLERSSAMRSHAGQIAFPGGAQDVADADAVAAAIREAEEETGLARAASTCSPRCRLSGCPRPTSW